MPPPRERGRGRGFTLLEVLCVCALLACLAAVAAPALGLRILRDRARTEDAALGALAEAARASFDSTDLEATNVAAFPASVPAGVDATRFSSSLDPAARPATTSAPDWFAKIARQLGHTPALGRPPTADVQPQVAAVLVNPDGNTRFLLAGPTGETAQQRLLFLSLMGPPDQLALPSWPDHADGQDPADLALFEDAWNADWDDPAAALPASWAARLTAEQAARWRGRLWQLRVRRIVCRKCVLTLNNNHPSDNCYVCYNLAGASAASTATAPAGSGVSVVAGIPEGRLVRAYRGAAPPPAAQLFSQFNLRGDCEITLQD